MSRRRGEFPKKKDDTFNRNTKGPRQLFNPSQHNPIAFNKKPNESQKTILRTPVQQECPTEQPLSEDSEKKRKRKMLINAIRDVELKLETLAQSSFQSACFREQTEEDTCSRHNLSQISTRLTEQDVAEAEGIWRRKIELHLRLAEAYLDIFKWDLEYAEKKGLESLCWKRAIYSLVDQFRRTIKRYGTPSEDSTHSELEDELAFGDEALTTQIPVLNPDGTMTMTNVESSQPEKNQSKPEMKYATLLLRLFLEYLDLADGFYQRLTQFLKSSADQQEDVQSYLSHWRRTKGYRWYSCIPLRCDIARYRFFYTPKGRVTDWQEAFEEAWKRYFLGIWLMPAKGNLYFNLSLLLQTKTLSAGSDFHKLYLSTRSLMVRRNGFLNAREGIMVLVEGNRRWVNKYLENKTKSKRDAKRQPSRGLIEDENDHSTFILGLFIKLHGMLLTKIGLDEFAKTKRLFFDALFPRTMIHCDSTATNEVIRHTPSNNEQFLSSHELFWFETAVLCLSSLYGYDYANSKLTKAVNKHMQDIFSNTDTLDGETARALEDDVLFMFGIDVTCQIALEAFKRYLDPELPRTLTPTLPKLPNISLQFQENESFLFGERKKATFSSKGQHIEENENEAWFVYIELLLQWIVLNGLCIRREGTPSFWERFISDIEYDLVYKEFKLYDRHHRSLISPAFWPLLIRFLNRLLSEIPYELHHELVTQYLYSSVDKEVENEPEAEQAFIEDIRKLGDTPTLPEEDYLRGLGWVDEAYGRILRSSQENKTEPLESTSRRQLDIKTRRKMVILDYGFILVNHMKDILSYDPVDQIFLVPSSVKDRILERVHKEQENGSDKDRVESLYDDEEVQEVPTMIAEMDDDVLLSTETDLNDDEGEDDIMTQLKKRREQLQSMVASEAEGMGYRRQLPARVKEREARLNYLRERILPDKTVLVLDTNCFIGHLEHVKKLIESEKWSIIVPLVVVTELDGLATNTQRLGTVAEKAVQLIESTLGSKPKQSNLLRVQTSHNSFMHNITIRSEQFMFGETDKNLDDLVLSCCLWWISQNKQDDVVPVCLVTGDRNLSVKARARDVEVVPVSAIMRLTPK
ncbi:hypothetical protein G6F43_006627 [Rhizopus delemar]|nr:hypothetical protein G6F43_006627 [Rhizopus delemar]